ncbi:MAG TPA: hypothetical protein VGB55_07925 [Tepidisphaeraceae bacterium]
MNVPVTIENEHLKLDVWPQFGGKVSSIIDKADGHELLFTIPTELPTRCQYGVSYAQGWYIGWDECFPAISQGIYPLHPYEGIHNPDHGECWSLPTTAVPTRDGITTVWHGLRFGYRLTRKLYLQGPAIMAEYSLVNLAPFEFRFAWALHALMSMSSPVEIDLGFSAMKNDQTWPALDEETTFTRSDALPTGRGWKRYSEQPIARPVTVRYPERKRSLSVEYASEDKVAGYWGIWINTGLWEGHHHFAIEPSSAQFDSIQRAIETDTAACVKPMGRINWSATMRVGAL